MMASVKSEGGVLGGTATGTVEDGSKTTDQGSATQKAFDKDGKPMGGTGEQGKGKSDVSKEGKLSGKELKEKAKAEKAARRAKEKGQQGQLVVDLGTKIQEAQTTRRPSSSGAAATPFKGQHKKSGSISGNTQKLPLRVAQSQAAPITEKSKEENKNVALFDHLYGPPRRTSLAGAGKDVHPAVLALGLQMRNYVVCGSSARCVATLLAFKRVSDVPQSLSIQVTDWF